MLLDQRSHIFNDMKKKKINMHEKKLKRLDKKISDLKEIESDANSKRCQCHDGKETGQELNL